MRKSLRKKIDVIDPRGTALLIIDMQEYFLVERAPAPLLSARKILEPLKKLIAFARSCGVAVIWTRVSHDHMLKGVYRDLWPEHFSPDGKALLRRDSTFFEIVGELKPLIYKHDLIIDKDKYSAFFQTNLELILRQRQLDTLLLTGVATNVCVESTLRDAYHRDFVPVLVSDCTGTLSDEMQEASMDTIGLAFGYVMSSKELEEALKQGHSSRT